MKARVKETGEIVRIEGCSSVFHYGKLLDRYIDTEGVKYLPSELEFDVKEKSLPKDEPDYWEKLKHQYAGMAMQGMLGNSDYIDRFTAHTIDGISDEDDIAKYAKDYATALVNRLKEEEL